MTDGYPTRDRCFAHKATRLLFKSCACQDLGHHSVLLIVHIAHTEDAARYQGAVRFWNSQLMETLGFKSPKQLTDARRRACDAGWLNYTRENDRAVGRYWVLIPPTVMKFDDLPIEESSTILSAGGIENGIENDSHSADGTGSGMHCGTGSGMHCGTGSGMPSYPYPYPIPKERGGATEGKRSKTAFVPPSVSEVHDYFLEIRYDGDHEAFVDHYRGNGWRVGKAPMKDWRATARNWKRRDAKSKSKPTAANGNGQRPVNGQSIYKELRPVE